MTVPEQRGSTKQENGSSNSIAMSSSVTVGAWWLSCSGPRPAGSFGRHQLRLGKCAVLQEMGRVSRLDRSDGEGRSSIPWATPYATALLNLFKWVLQSPGYVERLKKHYQLFRAAVDEEYAKRNRR